MYYKIDRQYSEIYSSDYIQFFFPFGSWNQGIIVFLDDVDQLYSHNETITVEEYLREINLWNSHVEWEETDENVYYFCAWGDVRELNASSELLS